MTSIGGPAQRLLPLMRAEGLGGVIPLMSSAVGYAAVSPLTSLHHTPKPLCHSIPHPCFKRGSGNSAASIFSMSEGAYAYFSSLKWAYFSQGAVLPDHVSTALTHSPHCHALAGFST